MTLTVRFAQSAPFIRVKKCLKARFHSTQERHDAHQQVCQQSTPYLPFYGIPATAYKGAYLYRLLDFLEESLDAPSTAIQIAYAGGSLFHIITQETDGYFLAVAIQNYG